MTGRVNWSRISSRNRMQRQGIEDRRGDISSVAPRLKKPQRRRAPSKAELRQQAAAAFLAWRKGQWAKDK